MVNSLIGLVVFLTLASALGAVVLAIKDFASRRTSSTSGDSASKAGPIRLRRLPRPADGPSSDGLVGTFDHWFLGLLRDTGLSLTPTTGAMLLVLCGAVVGGAVFVWDEHPLAGTVGVFVGMAVALTYLMVCRTRRIKLLQEQLSPALDMLAHGLRAGQSLDQAIEFVGDRSPEPLAAEFRVCAKQLEMGLSLPAAMRSLIGRVRLFDVRIFTAALTVHRQTGGDAAKVLQRLATVIRDRLNYRRQLRAMTAAGRLSVLLVGMIGPLLFFYMFFFHHQYWQVMLESTLGQTLLISAVVLEMVGFLWTARLLKPVY